MTAPGSGRGAWASRAGFILAAAGSAIGLGNLWRFPYIAGENGGGLFVVIYLAAIALVGLPIMIAEIMIGRHTQRSPVSAFKHLSPGSAWIVVGGVGVIAAYMILSVYAVVAGWGLHYTTLALRAAFSGRTAEEVQVLFGGLVTNPGLNVFWTVAFMALTVGVVLRGVEGGLERWTRILMPALFVLLVVLLGWSTLLDGFSDAFDFVFGLHADRLTAGGVLAALGHSFFTLSVGMGGMLTYGSYLQRDADIVGSSAWVAGLDTLMALMACLIIFPITFTAGLEPAQGPGLIFLTLPIAFAQMPGGAALAMVFFALIVFAALTSSISLLEVATSYFIDERSWSRTRATLVSGLGITALAIPAAISGAVPALGAHLKAATGRDWFDWIGDVSSDLLLPLGGLCLAIYAAWRLPAVARREEFATGNRFMRLYGAWLSTLRYLVPVAIGSVFVFLLRAFLAK